MKIDECLMPHELDALLQTEDSQSSEQVERHLERCENCRQRLQDKAGDPAWWQAAESNFSSLNNLATPITAADGNDDDDRASELSPTTEFKRLISPASHPEMLGRIGRYDIERMLGKGGFGVVFKGHDSELNRAVAIKVLAPHLSSSGVARRRFAREAQAAAAVSHPNVVPIHAVDAEHDPPYLVMSFIPGHSLETFVQRYGPLDVKSTVRIGQQVAAGLAAAHRQGLVHRDIKPGNILLENDLSRAMITDFGLARAADDVAATQTGWLAGTPSYMSPEQASGRDIDARSDLFSLGSVLYFLTTGRQPFRGESPLVVLRMIAEQNPLPVHQINSEIPFELSRIISRLLEKDPRDRFQSAALVEEHLEHYLAHLQHPQSYTKPKVGWCRREKERAVRFAMSAALGASILGGMIGWHYRSSYAEPVATEYHSEISIPANTFPQAPLTIEEARAMWRDENEFTESLNTLKQNMQDLELRSERWYGFGSNIPDQESDPFRQEIQSLHRELMRLEEDDPND